MDQVYLSWGDWYTVAPGEDNKNQSQETIVHQEWAEDEGNYKEVEKRKEASQLVARMPRQWQAKTQGVSNVARCHRKPGISTECPLHQTNRRPLRKLTCAEAVGLLLLLPSRFSRVRPHRRKPTRLRCLWDSPGKNTGVGLEESKWREITTKVVLHVTKLDWFIHSEIQIKSSPKRYVG